MGAIMGVVMEITDLNIGPRYALYDPSYTFWTDSKLQAETLNAPALYSQVSNCEDFGLSEPRRFFLMHSKMITLVEKQIELSIHDLGDNTADHMPQGVRG